MDLYIALHVALLTDMHAMPNTSVVRVTAGSESRFKPEMRGLIVQAAAFGTAMCYSNLTSVWIVLKCPPSIQPWVSSHRRDSATRHYHASPLP